MGGPRMLLLVGALWFGVAVAAAEVTRFALVVPSQCASPCAEKGVTAWERLLSAVGVPVRQTAATAVEADFRGIIVPAVSGRALGAEAIERLLAAARHGALLIAEQDSALSRAAGVRFQEEKVRVVQIEDALYPKIMTIWERPAEAVRAELPEGARVLVHEKWSRAPLVATFPFGRGRVVFLAAELDPQHGEGYARFPFLLHALVKECGVRPPFQSPRLHAFFDYGYRSGVDLEYFGRRWRLAGIEALHVAAWHFWDRNRDDYLKQLISTCHRNGILVYAWFEFPHVSDAFWEAHPQWREKTATLADAKLDWRALVNLLDADAFAEVSRGLRGMLAGFDWDGVNIGELYFESPLGPSNPHRFTPMNDDVRAGFRTVAGVDPLDLFRKESPHYWEKDVAAWKRFVDYRAGLLAGLHERLLGVADEARRAKPWLDVNVTYVDNLYDARMKEAIGADVERIAPLGGRHDLTLIMEDPGTVWSHGPRRYQMLGERYRQVSPRVRWGIDINVVERYQDVYPTKKQTGAELLQQLHFAALNFSRVLVYFEQSVYAHDYELIAGALAAGARVVEETAEQSRVESPGPVMFRAGPGRVFVDGVEWPVRDGDDVMLPTGVHSIRAEEGNAPAFRLFRFNGNLVGAAYEGRNGIRFRYDSRGRAIALLTHRPTRVVVDGGALEGTIGEAFGYFSVMLPAGEHEVVVESSH